MSQYSHVPGDEIVVEVRVIQPDPRSDRQMVLLQFPDGFIVIPPATAAEIGRAMQDAARRARP